MTPDPEEEEGALLDVAHEAARAAAAELQARFGSNDGIRVKSGPTDLVSDADLAAESAIHAVLAARRPDDAILAEEGGASGGRATGEGASEGGGSGGGDLRWVVDPLDGTTNYLFGVPVFSVSIACEDAAGAIVGVVLDPNRAECFAATRSGAATLNGDPIRPAARADGLARSLVVTGFGYDAAQRARQAQVVARVLPAVRDIRRLGSAALDLCWTACGRYDAYYERGLKPWDCAAGALIASRAGLEVRTLEETEEDPFGLAVAPAGLIEGLLELVSN